MVQPVWQRRRFLATAGLAGAAAALSGCGGSSTGSGVGLRYMYWGSAFEKRGIEQMLDQFGDEHPGVTVEPIHVPGDYETKINTLVASNDLPDVAYLGAATAYRLAEQGKLLDLEPHLKDYPLLADRSPGSYFYWAEGKNLGTHASNQIILTWYNRATLTAAGVEPPPAVAADAWDWDTLINTADRLTVDRDGRHPSEAGFNADQVAQFGLSLPMTHWYSLVRSNGGNIADEAGTRCLLNTPEVIEVFQRMQDAVHRHRVSPSPAQLGAAESGSAPTTTVLLQTKRVAMAIDGHWTLLDLGQSDLDYGVGVLPAFQEPITQRNRTPRVIRSGAEHLEQTLQLYTYAMDPEHIDLFRAGLWMPVDEKYFTDETALATWINPDVHPPEFKTAAIDYMINNSVTGYAERLKNATAINEVVTPALQQIELGTRPAADVLNELAAKVEPLLQGWYPGPETYR